VLGPGLSLYFRALRTLALLFAILMSTCVPGPPASVRPAAALIGTAPHRAPLCSARRVYSVNIIITLAASSDARADTLHGVENLSRLSVWSMQTLLDPVTGGPSSLYGKGSPKAFVGADKRDLLIVISVLDVCAMLAVLAVLTWFRRSATAEEQLMDSETATIDDYTAVVHGLPREALDAADVQVRLLLLGVCLRSRF